MPEQECYTREDMENCWIKSSESWMSTIEAFDEYILTLHQKPEEPEEVFNLMDIAFNLVLMELEYDD